MKQTTTEAEQAKIDGRINSAVHELAQRLGVEPSTVQIVTYEERVWRDGSIGCPQPGMMYTQALVPGYLIQLRLGDETFNYHGANGRDPFLCESGEADSHALPGP
jgi:hypothetical protein